MLKVIFSSHAYVKMNGKRTIHEGMEGGRY